MPAPRVNNAPRVSNNIQASAPLALTNGGGGNHPQVHHPIPVNNNRGGNNYAIPRPQKKTTGPARAS
jgi:hypothetical protein